MKEEMNVAETMMARDLDSVRHRKDKRRTPGPPMQPMSARAANIEESDDQPDPSMDVTQPSAQPVDDDIDIVATSSAIKDAVRTVGKRFSATKEERREMRRLLCPEADTARNRMDMALVLAIIILAIMLINSKK